MSSDEGKSDPDGDSTDRGTEVRTLGLLAARANAARRAGGMRFGGSGEDRPRTLHRLSSVR